MIINEEEEEIPFIPKKEFEEKLNFFLLLKMIIVFLCSILASGPLQAFPTLEPLLIDAKVFANNCPNGILGCIEQEIQLSNMYTIAVGVSLGLFCILGYIYDRTGPRFTSTLGALGVAVGMIATAVSIYFPWLNWVLYISLPVTDVFGFLNSFAFIGFIWHVPKYQVFIIGIGSASYEMSAIMGVFLKWIVRSFGVSLSLGFVILGGISCLVAVGSLLFVPSQAEYYERASYHLKKQCEPPHESFFALSKGALKVLSHYKLENIIFLLFIIAALCYLQNYVADCFDYYQLFLGSELADNLSTAFGFLQLILAAFAAPFTGILFDWIGFTPFVVGLLITQIIFTALIFVPNYYAAIVSIIFGFIWLSVLYNLIGKWYVHYAPPELLGLLIGASYGISGMVEFAIVLALSALLVKYSSGIGIFFYSFVITGSFSLLFTFILTLVVCIKPRPTKPPSRF